MKPEVPELEFFEWGEFACRCGCGKNEFQPSTAVRVNKARGYSGVPYVVTSAYRCPVHNRVIGSKSNVHPRGYAVDIAAGDSRSRFKIIQGMIKAGFTRIGIAKDFIHGDDDPTKAPEVSWLY